MSAGGGRARDDGRRLLQEAHLSTTPREQLPRAQQITPLKLSLLENKVTPVQVVPVSVQYCRLLLLL